MDRSTRNLSIIILLVVAIFVAVDRVSSQAAPGDWWLVLLLLLLALGIWGYDRLSRRGVDDSEATDSVIEPVTYERTAALTSNAPSTAYQQAEPKPVQPEAQAAAVKAAQASVVQAAESTIPQAEPVVELQSPPMPARPRPDVDSKRAPEAATPIRAAASKTQTPAPDAMAEDKTEPAPPVPAAEQHPPAAAVTTSTIEEKSAPPPSAAAPETVPAKARRKAATASAAPPAAPVTKAAKPAAAKSPSKTKKKAAASTQADDLKRVEGIGPKMEKALNAAGISTFAQLASTTEDTINAAIVAAGMRFAPSVPTWAEQASYAAKGDFAGLEAFQKTLVGGRKV